MLKMAYQEVDLSFNKTVCQRVVEKLALSKGAPKKFLYFTCFFKTTIKQEITIADETKILFLEYTNLEIMIYFLKLYISDVKFSEVGIISRILEISD